MLNRVIIHTMALVAILVMPVAASGGYTVTLTNGNTLSANSYVIKGNKVNLIFPVGEAAIKLSDVVSIKEDGGRVVLFQEEGVYSPGAPEADTAPAAERDYEEAENTAPAVSGHAAGNPHPIQNFGNTDYQPVQRRWSRANYSPQITEIDSFVDEMFKADAEGREVSEEEIDKAFSSFFDDGSGTGSLVR